ncbi:MAG TPA: hypothetical protein VIL11_01080 [Limnochordales bacterium]
MPPWLWWVLAGLLIGLLGMLPALAPLRGGVAIRLTVSPPPNALLPEARRNPDSAEAPPAGGVAGILGVRLHGRYLGVRVQAALVAACPGHLLAWQLRLHAGAGRLHLKRAWRLRGRMAAPELAAVRPAWQRVRQAVALVRTRGALQAAAATFAAVVLSRVAWKALHARLQVGLGDAMATGLACSALQAGMAAGWARLPGPARAAARALAVTVVPRFGPAGLHARAVADGSLRGGWIPLAIGAALLRAGRLTGRPRARRGVQAARATRALA